MTNAAKGTSRMVFVLQPGRDLLGVFDVEGTVPKAGCYEEPRLCFCLLLAETVGIPYCTVSHP